jgi:tRNA A37 N6-isopentenylltransferase MiaA
LKARDEIMERRRIVIYAGGTGLYFRALFRGLMDLEIPGDRLAEIRHELSEMSTGAMLDELKQRIPRLQFGYFNRTRESFYPEGYEVDWPIC